MENGEKCYKCKIGYSIDKNGKCVKGVANCKVLDETDDKKCKECMSEYYINSK